MIQSCLRAFFVLIPGLTVLICQDVYAQPFVGGLKKMTGRDITVGNKLAVSDDDFAKLPKAVSYERFCPIAGNQNGKATTVAYATAYYLRTILENQAQNLSETTTVNANRFSPAYLYSRIKSNDDADCSAGAELETALRMLRTEGVPLLKTVGEQACNPPVSTVASQEASRYRISDYELLFGPNDSKINKLRLLKKTLAGGTPVVIEFQAPESFTLAKKVWTRATNETLDMAPYGLALCVIAYDDNQTGGAFQVANSWGSGWGDGGKTWITYQDMLTFTRGAYRVSPVSTAPKARLLAGQVEIRLTTGQSVPVALTSGVGVYQPSGPYPAGQEIKLYASSSERTYLYIFGFSPDGVNRYVPGSDESTPVVRPGDPFVFPAQSQTVTLEKAIGQDYLLFLFCQEPIGDVGMLTRKLQQTPGTPRQKIAAVVTNQPANGIEYAADAMKFSLTTAKTSVQVLVLVRL
ncbi:DUF4384 domain-containing protein [Spirosoma jeollabukense]